MGFVVKNLSGGVVSLDDIGLTLAIGEEYDLVEEQGNEVATSADLVAAINAGDVVILDPLDDLTELSLADSLIAASVQNIPNYRIFGGDLNQLDDVSVAGSPTPLTEVLTLSGSPPVWTNAPADDIERMRWLRLWTPKQYEKNDVVRDGDWTMIANTQTTERAAPTPLGNPQFAIEGGSPLALGGSPIWNHGSNLSVVEVAHTYTFATGGWLPLVRIWPDEVSDSYTYRLRVTEESGSPVTGPRDFFIPIQTLVENQWNDIATDNHIVVTGSVLKLELIIDNSAATTSFTGGWTFDTRSNGNSAPPTPAAESFTINGNGRIRIDKDDLNTIDRSSELLSVTPNSEIKFTETADTSNNETYRVEADPFDGGTYVEYICTLIDTGAGGPATVGETTTCDFTIPTPSNTEYVEKPNVWNATIPDYLTSVTSELAYGGVDQAASANTAYGIDFLFQRAYVSPDWDLIATSQIVGAAPGGGGGTDELVKVSVNDSVAGYLGAKLVAGFNITLTENNDGGNETLTIDAAAGSPTPNFNIFETVEGDTGSQAAQSSTDTLAILGGTNINTSIALAGSPQVATLTIDSTSAGSPIQDLFDRITGDAGSLVASSPNDELAIVGGTGISTTVTLEGSPQVVTATITNTDPNVDQNIFETVEGDTGTENAGNPNDTLAIVGGTSINTAVTLEGSPQTPTVTISNGAPSPAGLSVATISGNEVLVLKDVTRPAGSPVGSPAFKTLSVETVTQVWERDRVNALSVMHLGGVDTNATAYTVLRPSTIIGAHAQSGDSRGNTRDYHLYVNKTIGPVLGTITGGSPMHQSFQTNDLNIDVEEGDYIQVLADVGSRQDGVILQLFYKWRA